MSHCAAAGAAILIVIPELHCFICTSLDPSSPKRPALPGGPFHFWGRRARMGPPRGGEAVSGTAGARQAPITADPPLSGSRWGSEIEIAARTRSAIRDPVNPTSSCSRDGLPWTT